MAKSLADPKYNPTVKFLTEEVEPRIHRIVEEVNGYLKKKGIRVGAEINWIMDDVTDEVANEKAEDPNQDPDEDSNRR